MTLERFAPFGATLAAEAIGDFSGLRRGAGRIVQVAPRRAEVLCGLVQAAAEHAVPLRIRGAGHSLNGSSLPRDGELLVCTDELRHLWFEAPGTVTVGGGAVLWVLQHVLNEHGFDLPVLNDGYPGPSVGGYLAAGGFGPRSGEHGGFWDNVAALTLVDGRGALRRVTSEDPVFPWLFGAMGQLGIVFDATLKIMPLAGAAREYPAGKMLRVPRLARPVVPAQFATSGDERLFWFTLFVPQDEVGEAHAGLAALEGRHRGALRYAARYTYPIAYRGLSAPLVYPHGCAFTATGAWGWLRDASAQAVERLTAFDRDFFDVATSRPRWRRYVQSELAGGPDDYLRSFGAQACAELRRLKAELDPRRLFNRGSVFDRGE